MNLKFTAIFVLFLLTVFGSSTVFVAANPGMGFATSSLSNHHGFLGLNWSWFFNAILSSTSVDSQINGTIIDASTQMPIANATVAIDGDSTLTDVNGTYDIEIGAGNYTVTASMMEYQNQSHAVSIAVNQTVTVNFNLTHVQQMGSIHGKVLNANTSMPIQGAQVSADNQTATTNSTGDYRLQVEAPSSYNVTALKAGYVNETIANVTVQAGQTVNLNFTLTPISQPVGAGILEGNVTDANTGKPLPGAIIYINGKSETTNASGTYMITLNAGAYNVTAAKSGYINQTAVNVTITANMTTVKNFKLVPVTPQKIKVTVQIHPETLNLESNGRWISVSIEFPTSLNASVDIRSIKLNGTIEADVAGPIEMINHNGLSTLTFKMSRDAVEDLIIGSDDHMSKFSEVALVLTGQLEDKTPFTGTTTIRAIFNQLKPPH